MRGVDVKMGLGNKSLEKLDKIVSRFTFFSFVVVFNSILLLFGRYDQRIIAIVVLISTAFNMKLIRDLIRLIKDECVDFKFYPRDNKSFKIYRKR